MAWLSVDNDGAEIIHKEHPYRNWGCKEYWSERDAVLLPKGSIKKLIGRELTWDDEPVELKEEKE